MAPLQTLRSDLRDERFRTAALLGVGSIPFTVGVNWVLSPDPVSATSLSIACVLSGYLSNSRSIPGTRAGAVTGIVGGLPIVVFQGWTALVES